MKKRLLASGVLLFATTTLTAQAPGLTKNLLDMDEEARNDLQDMVYAGKGSELTVQQPQSTTSWYDDSFTDSTGRTLLFRLWVRSDWDLTVPRGVVLFFHGNNQGTAEELRSVGWGVVDDALELGLAVVVPASPESLPEGVSFGEWTLVPTATDRGGERFWSTTEDARLVHELLQGNLNSRLEIDHDRVVFSGGSQGTCFLAEFVEFYGGSYGGGFHAWCGCFWLDLDGDDSHDTNATPPFLASPWRPTFQWTPFAASVVRDRFKVFVEATTEDFLYPAAVSMSRYYPEYLGLDTRTDLEMPGRHCYHGATPRSEIFEWLSSGVAPAHPGTSDDTDGDGTPNQFDLDDDNDGAPDFIDALPDDARDWRDTDRDGIADAIDRDADGDGVRNALDAFPLDVREWRDTDGDGIGDELDTDDNDGGRGLAFVNTGRIVSGYTGTYLRARAHVHARRPATVVYPAPRGHSQSYQFLELGHSADGRFEIMVDSFVRPEACPAILLPQLCDVEQFVPSGYLDGSSVLGPLYSSYFQDQYLRIWVDRNRNRDLTDDGPPLLSGMNTEWPWRTSTTEAVILEVPYASGQLLPYGITMSPVPDDLSDGLVYRGTSVWKGQIEAPSGGRMLAVAVDGNLDGLFDSQDDALPDGFRDFVCLDLDRDGLLNECDFTEDAVGNRMRPGALLPSEPFGLDGGRYSLSVAPWGREIRIVETDGAEPDPEPDEAPCRATGEGINLDGHQLFMCIVVNGEVQQLTPHRLSSRSMLFGRLADPKAVVKLVRSCQWGAVAAVTTARKFQIRVYNTANGKEWIYNHNTNSLAPSGYSGDALCD